MCKQYELLKQKVYKHETCFLQRKIFLFIPNILRPIFLIEQLDAPDMKTNPIQLPHFNVDIFINFSFLICSPIYWCKNWDPERGNDFPICCQWKTQLRLLFLTLIHPSILYFLNCQGPPPRPRPASWGRLQGAFLVLYVYACANSVSLLIIVS